MLENTVKLDMGLKPLGTQGEGHWSCNQDRTKGWGGGSISNAFTLRVSEDPDSTPQYSCEKPLCDGVLLQSQNWGAEDRWVPGVH